MGRSLLAGLVVLFLMTPLCFAPPIGEIDWDPDDIGPQLPYRQIVYTAFELLPDAYMAPGDLDGDGVVNLLDFGIMVSNWLVDCNVNPVDPACELIPLD